MIAFFVQLTITAALLLLVANLVKGVHVDDWASAVVAALVLGLINALIRPILVFVTLPLTLLTFGLFLLVINAVMLQLTAALSPGIRVDGCGAALVGSLLISLLSVAIRAITG
jgi:putative membrane protein